MVPNPLHAEAHRKKATENGKQNYILSLQLPCLSKMDGLLQDVRQEAWGGLIPTELSMDSSEVTSLQRPLPLYVSSETESPACLPRSVRETEQRLLQCASALSSVCLCADLSCFFRAFSLSTPQAPRTLAAGNTHLRVTAAVGSTPTQPEHQMHHNCQGTTILGFCNPLPPRGDRCFRWATARHTGVGKRQTRMRRNMFDSKTPRSALFGERVPVLLQLVSRFCGFN